MTCLRHGRKAGGYWAAQNGRSRQSQSCGDRSISALGVARSPQCRDISAFHWPPETPEIRPTSSRPAATPRFVRASAFPPRRPLTSRPSSLQIGRGVMRRLNIEDRLALSLRPRALTHVRQYAINILLLVLSPWFFFADIQPYHILGAILRHHAFGLKQTTKPFANKENVPNQVIGVRFP
ncbi:hypothetical protein NDU88_006625 [Pleurodeles waltl]|uniref:Uncharacterized protein n=1 Tax=Pleurodeles waltl TaxID=8319 RepID=A0AAV7X4L4_PLEWA|nr:hypothetical protein NDU88_006625 [Pleurodeles waltl]